MDSLIGRSGPQPVLLASSFGIPANSALDRSSRTRRFFPPLSHLPKVVVAWRSGGGK